MCWYQIWPLYLDSLVSNTGVNFNIVVFQLYKVWHLPPSSTVFVIIFIFLMPIFPWHFPNFDNLWWPNTLHREWKWMISIFIFRSVGNSFVCDGYPRFVVKIWYLNKCKQWLMMFLLSFWGAKYHSFYVSSVIPISVMTLLICWFKIQLTIITSRGMLMKIIGLVQCKF